MNNFTELLNAIERLENCKKAHELSNTINTDRALKKMLELTEGIVDVYRSSIKD